MQNVQIRKVLADDLPVVYSMVQALAAHHGDAATLRPDDLARDCLGAQPWVNRSIG